ncbi:hypothetical protein BJX65DRAFT_306811 [Aspergillus insuetus]
MSYDRAALEAQASNNIDIICAPHSVFLDLRVDCTTCIERFIAAENGTALQQDLGPTFQQWINYCDTVEINNSTQEVDINALLSSWSSLAATQSALTAVTVFVGLCLLDHRDDDRRQFSYEHSCDSRW